MTVISQFCCGAIGGVARSGHPFGGPIPRARDRRTGAVEGWRAVRAAQLMFVPCFYTALTTMVVTSLVVAGINLSSILDG